MSYLYGRLNIVHVRNFSIVDVISRYLGMLGKYVLQRIGWDSFGLPA
ncbi:class I tRNA ligase family protein [Erwinia amylovora]